MGSVIIFVDKQEHADGLLKDLMNASYTSCSSLHGKFGDNVEQAWLFYNLLNTFSRWY